MTDEQDAAVERVMEAFYTRRDNNAFRAAVRTELTAEYERGRASMYLTMQAYAWHNDKCTWFENDDEACTCGFNKITEKAEALAEESTKGVQNPG